MGTTVEVYLYAADAGRAASLFEVVFQEVERVEAALSTYRPSSELSRINTYAVAMPVTTDPEVFGLVGRALAYSRETGGAFDITVGRLMKAWGFFRGQGRYPSEEALAEARRQTGWQYVALDTTARAVRFQRMGLELDMGAIGKGYAIDRAVRLLRAQGVAAALIGTGQSSYYAVGAPPGEDGWLIKVPAPFDRARTFSSVRLRDAALSTSGNYEKFFDLEGRRYCHIMDPRTGRPVEGMVQATVIAPGAAESDALATSVFVLGADAGAVLLDAHPGTAALLVTGTPPQTQVVPLGWPEDVAEVAR
jgi:thiamine biosynthesis lipoprotein